MNRKVVLIYPRLNKDTPQQKPFLPLPVLAIAGPLETRGFEVRILDEHVEDVHEQLSHLDSSPVCFGISCMAGYQVKSGLQIARKIRNLFPDCPIVWGGWFPTLLSRIAIADSNVDIIVKGKGEIIFSEIVEALSAGRSPEGVQGIVIERDGQIFETPDRPLDDPNGFPRPPYHLVDFSRYSVSEGILNYSSSYGCPFRCTFCGITTALQRKWNGGLKPERVLDDFEEMVSKHGIRHVVFHEDNFCCNPQRAKDIWRGMVERGLNLTWEANTRVDQLVRFDTEMLKLLGGSHQSRLYLGVESLVPSTLDFIQKDITVEQVEKAVQLAKEYDLPLVMNIIAGLPTDTRAGYMETLRKMKSFLELHNKLKVVIYQYGAIPGTPLYEFEKQEGRVHVYDSLEEWGNAFEDLSFSGFDYNKKIAKYTNKIFRIISFHFRHAYLAPETTDGRSGLMTPVLLKAISHTLSLRFRYDFWALPVEWGMARLSWKALNYLNMRSAYTRPLRPSDGVK